MAPSPGSITANKMSALDMSVISAFLVNMHPWLSSVELCLALPRHKYEPRLGIGLLSTWTSLALETGPLFSQHKILLNLENARGGYCGTRGRGLLVLYQDN